MVPEFEEVAFGLPVGEISEPVQSQFGFHIIEVLEIDENRALEPAELESARATAFNQWRQEQRASADMRRLWSLEAVPDLPEALANLQSALPPQPIPTHTPAP
jgi:parvulin-like peptidyl-prolyl isomerase